MEIFLCITSVILSVNAQSSPTTPPASTGLHLREGCGNQKQTIITTDFQSQSSAVNDNGFSLGSNCCSSNFFFFFFFFNLCTLCKVIRGKILYLCQEQTHILGTNYHRGLEKMLRQWNWSRRQETPGGTQ